jgi:transcriptional regulator with XRE-family HTH domain
MKYIDKLNALCYSKKLSIYEIGLECELSESAVKKILSKRCAPRVPSLEKLCETIGTSLPELFCADDERVIKVTDETAKLIAVYGLLPAESKKHLLCFLDCLNKK